MASKNRRKPGIPGGTGPDDPVATSPRVRDQPALTTSSGRSWLILGGLLAAISIGVMVPMMTLEPVGAARIGLVLVGVLYAVMLVAGLLGRTRLRLGIMAAAMIAIAVVALVTVFIVAAAEWRQVG